MKNSDLTARDLWLQVRGLINDSPESYLLIDDSVQAKPYGPHIELCSRQYSGATHSVVNGFGVVNLVHVSADASLSFPIDYTISAKQVDGKTKNDHFREMIDRARDRGVQARTVLFDEWYSSVENLKFLHRRNLFFYTTIQRNRKVSLDRDSGYQSLADVPWTDGKNPATGVRVKLKELPFHVWLFKLVAQDGNIDWVITNDPSHDHDNGRVAQKNAVRWKIEELHRELKQLTSSDRCQARLARVQRTHLACCYRALVYLRYLAKIAGLNPYAVKDKLRRDGLRTIMAAPLPCHQF